MRRIAGKLKQRMAYVHMMHRPMKQPNLAAARPGGAPRARLGGPTPLGALRRGVGQAAWGAKGSEEVPRGSAELPGARRDKRRRRGGQRFADPLVPPMECGAEQPKGRRGAARARASSKSRRAHGGGLARAPSRSDNIAAGT